MTIEQQDHLPERAGPAELKEFVERDALAARRQLEAALAKQPNAVNLWEAFVWTFVLTSDPPMVIESARRPRALARGRRAGARPDRAVQESSAACLLGHAPL